MSRPRAATSVAMRIEVMLGEGEEKRSRVRRRDFCGIWLWRACAGSARFWRKGVRRRTVGMEFVKIKVRGFGWERRRV